MTVVEPQLRGKGRSSGRSRAKHAMKGFAVLIKPLVHGARLASGTRGERGGVVGNGEKGGLQQGESK